MKEFLNGILPRIIDYSQSLDHKETFIEKPWTWIDDLNNQQKYIFRRNGDLLMSLNGSVTIGKWEYISAAKSLLIDRIKDKLLLNQAFLDEAVIILKHDGIKGEKFMLLNELLLPNLNFEDYLRNLFYKKNGILISKLEDGKNLEVHQAINSNTYNEKPVTIDMEPVQDGRYVTEKGNIAIVNSGLLKGFYILQEKKLQNGVKFHIEASFFHQQDEIPLDTFIYKEDGVTPLEDGKYKYSSFSNFYVQDGKVTKTSIF